MADEQMTQAALNSLQEIDATGNVQLFKDSENILFATSADSSYGQDPVELKNTRNRPYRAPKANSSWQVVGAESFKGANHLGLWNENSMKLRVLGFTDGWKMNRKNKNYRASRQNYFEIEKLFDQDFDDNGSIGREPPIYTVVEGIGSVELVKDQYRYLYADPASNGTPVNISRKNGKWLKASKRKTPKWSLIGAETVDSQNYLLWEQTASQSIRSWTCDSDWKQIKASQLFKPGTDGFLQLEDLFKQDVDEDGHIGPIKPTFSTIESLGNTALIQDEAQKAYAEYRHEGGKIPIMSAAGQQLNIGSDASELELVGAERVDGFNKVVWLNHQLDGIKSGIFNQRWELQSEGQIVFDDDAEFHELEVEFQQDFNLDAHIGERPKQYTLIEDHGLFSLFKDQSNFAYVSGKSASNKYDVRDISDEPINVGSAASDLQVIAAESYESENHLAVKENLTGAIKTWTLDSEWDWDDLSESEPVYAGSKAFNALEILFDQDFDVDGHVGGPPKVYTNIESDGSITLMHDQSNYGYIKLASDGAIHTITDRDGADVNVGSAAATKAMIAAETFDSKNHVVWKTNADSSIDLWTLDANWRELTSENSIAAGNARYHELEKKFDTDFDADGFVGEQPKVYTSIESIGNTTLLHDQSNFAYVRASAADTTPISINLANGEQVDAGSSASVLQMLAAETINSTNKIVWRDNQNKQLKTWTLDASWNVQSETAFAAPGSDSFNAIEEEFQEDFDQNGIIGALKDFWTTEQYFDRLWGFENRGQFGGLSGDDIRAVPAFTRFGSTVNGINNLESGENIVAVLDTGVRITHEDLKDNILLNNGEIPNDGLDNDSNGFIDDYYGYDFAYDDSSPDDVNGHGTHVAGTVAAASNGLGVIGGNPVAKILPVKVLNDQGSGFMSGIVSGVNYAVQRGAKILNMSLGGPGYSHSLNSAITHAGEQGSLTIVAAGNENNDNDVNPVSPASFDIDAMVSVGATTPTDERASFSNYGRTTVDLYAPGQSIFSTGSRSDTDYHFFSGTSMATPLVAGVVSSYWARHPEASALTVKSRLMDSVRPLDFPINTVTGGLMDMDSFLKGSHTSSSLSSQRVAASMTAGQFDHLPKSKKTHILHELNYHQTSKKHLKHKKLIGHVKGETHLDRQDTLKQMQNSIDNNTLKHIESVEPMHGLGTTLAIIDFSSKKKSNPHQSLQKMFEDDHFNFFELDQKINVPTPKLDDSNNSRYGFHHYLSDDDHHLTAADGDDHLTGHKGDNHLNGGGGHDHLEGLQGDDTLNGGSGDDTLNGGPGEDTLNGGDGNDRLHGSTGDDHLTGNKGTDSFVLSHGHDVIYDFNPKKGEHLVVDLDEIPYVKLIQQGADLVVSMLDGDARTILKNTQESQILANNAIVHE